MQAAGCGIVRLMTSERASAAHRFSVFAEQVLVPAVFPHRAALSIAAYQCADPIPFEQAARATFVPVELGWRWGPVWSSAWFQLRGSVPSEMAGRCVVLRFSTETEALLYEQGLPRQGLDVNHESAVLFERAPGGAPVDVMVEAACNRPLGATTFFWDDKAEGQRWAEATPGRLALAELATFDRDVWVLWQTYDFATQLVRTCQHTDPRGRQLCEALDRVTNMIADWHVPKAAAEATAWLRNALTTPGQGTRTSCFAVGHAHIDTAWLWRVRETKRKCVRTFSTAQRLLETYPDFRFLCSQAQQYAWLEQSSPETFEQISGYVEEGRWEPGGAMWVEPDCNVPSGESLVRQILYGTRYWLKRFGARGAQRYVYLPDSFGFSAALPQIMRSAGLDTFITNKLSWNETNEFPHVSFRWRGIDGSEVLAHCTPGRDYNATMTPAELKRGEENTARLDKSGSGLWLQPFGYGDGGGGPTSGGVHFAQLAAACDGLPEVRFSRVDEFCAALHDRRVADTQAGRDWPVWDGELYLEFHRGTLTTQAWLKAANRRAELALRAAEWLYFAGPTPRDAETGHVADRLGEAWKLVLLNQFHDILPGTSIGAVYDDARKEHAAVAKACASVAEDGRACWAEAADTRGLVAPMLVWNACSSSQSGVVSCEGKLHHVADVPGMGARIVDRQGGSNVDRVRLSDRTLSNGLISASIDELGRLGSLVCHGLDRRANALDDKGHVVPMNQLVLYEDRPRSWEAWDIDREYVRKAYPVVDSIDEWSSGLDDTGLRGWVEVSRALGQGSRITQRYVLDAGAPRLDVVTRVEWNERRRLLRALFPVQVRSRYATYEIQFGHLQRPTHRNTTWDQARFEVCGHRWMDLSEPGFGVALLSDSKYGYSCDGHVLGVSLLRSPMFPDPAADQGVHAFTYSLMPHNGDWRGAGVDEEAALLNDPLVTKPLRADQAGVWTDAWAPFALTCEGAAFVAVSAVKQMEGDPPSGTKLIVRLVETHGGAGTCKIDWRLPVQVAMPVDVMERPLDHVRVDHGPGTCTTTMPIRPFEIVTLAVSLAEGDRR